MARQLPEGVVSVRQWCYGELEFDAFMRQLDNAVSLSRLLNSRSLSLFGWLLNRKAARVEVSMLLAFLHWVGIALHP